MLVPRRGAIRTGMYMTGADRFLTNRKDFPPTITEIDIVYAEDLPSVA